MPIVEKTNNYINEVNESKGLSIARGDTILDCLNNILDGTGNLEKRHTDLDAAVYDTLTSLGSGESPSPGPQPIGDGKTHFQITVPNETSESIRSVDLYARSNTENNGSATVNIDWGDGSPNETITLSNIGRPMSHVYSFGGDYDISVDVIDGNIALYASSTVRVISSSYGAYTGLLNAVEIGDNCTAIDGNAFYNVSSLSKVIFSSTDITSIGNNAFSGCRSLQSIDIPSSVTELGIAAFNNCTALRYATLPNGISNIPDSLFNSCNCLNSITIPDSVTSIGTNAFYGCAIVKVLGMPNVTTIGSQAFCYCSLLESITLPEGLTSIGNSAFNTDKSLTSITIPSSVTTIGSQVFRYCSGLTECHVTSETPPTLGSNSFANALNVVIYVPASAVGAYSIAPGWSSVAGKIRGE